MELNVEDEIFNYTLGCSRSLVVKTLNLEISGCRLPNYVKELC